MIGHDMDTAERKGARDFNKDKVVFEARNITALLGAKPISFKLHEREILGFFGLVGAGRTEMARVLFGVDPIGEGEIYVHGNKVKISCPRDAINAGIGLVPEDRKGLGLILDMSIKDNMLISKIGQLSSPVLKKEQLKQITGSFISDLSIKLRNEGQYVKELSGGNQQKVVIAKWLAMTPDILIMDEPTRGIDVGAKAEIYRLILQLAQQGKTILVNTLEIPELQKVADRCVVFYHGLVQQVLSLAEITEERVMLAATNAINAAEGAVGQ